MATLVEPPVAVVVADTGAAPPSQTHVEAAAVPAANPWIAAISVMLATFMEVLDTAIASVALPYIAGSLAASNSEATWVLTSYLIANAVVLPASNWFALRFGRKRFLISCVVIFTFASFWCGAAPSLWILLLARVVQGAGGGALQPLSQAILLESFPPKKRGAAMALFGFGVVVAPVLGPTLGGWLTDSYSWRYAFYINIPVGILAVFMISRFVHDPPYIKNAKAGPFDNLGFGLLCLWSGALQVILDKGQEDDWFGAVWIRWAVLILAGLADVVHLAFVEGEAAAGGPENPGAESQLRGGLPAGLHAGLCHLRHRRHDAVVLPGSAGLHGAHGRPGRRAARHRLHDRLAHRGHHHAQGRQPLAAHLGIFDFRPLLGLVRQHQYRHRSPHHADSRSWSRGLRSASSLSPSATWRR